MTAIFGTESYEGGALGATITEGNTTHVSVGAGWTFANDPAPAIGLGAQYARVEVAAATTSYAQASFTATDIAVPRMYVRFPTVPATGSVDIATVRSGASLRARLGISGGKYVLRNGSTVVWTSTTDVAATVWNRLEWRLDNTTGQQQLRIYRGSNHHGTVADEDSGNVTLTTGAGLDAARFGPAQNALTTSWVAYYDGVIISDVTWPGPAYTAPAPTPTDAVTVNAGGDQLAVEPWATIPLTATETGTGITARAWSQTQGTTVTLTNAGTASATFEAPATLQGAALQFKYEATYATGVATDAVNVTVRAVTERAVIGGKEVPMRILNVIDPDPLTWVGSYAWQPTAGWGDHSAGGGGTPTVVPDPPAPAKMDSLRDAFDTMNTSRWTFSSNAALNAGRLQLTPTTTYGGALSVATYDLTGSSFYVEVAQTAGPGNGTVDTSVLLQIDANNDLSITREGNVLYAQRHVAGVGTSTSTLAYSATAHRWWRFSESGGVVTWSVSANGTTWASLGTWAPTFPITALRVSLNVGYYGTEPTPGTALFDNVNGG